MSVTDRRPLRARNGKRRYRSRADDVLFETMKASWVAAHPQHTSEEYQAAVRRIAAMCGV